jgi:transposase-like protein
MRILVTGATRQAGGRLVSVLRGASWQRCRTHFVRNPSTRVPEAAHAIVATCVRTIFIQPDAESVRARRARTVERLRNRFPRAAALLEDEAEDLLASFSSATPIPAQRRFQTRDVCSEIPIFRASRVTGVPASTCRRA